MFIYVVLCVFALYVFFFKQKTAYEMRISDWSSDVCSSDLLQLLDHLRVALVEPCPAAVLLEPRERDGLVREREVGVHVVVRRAGRQLACLGDGGDRKSVV